LEREGIDVFLNIRTDVYLLGHPDATKETKKRIKLYSKAGADGLFTPCIEKKSDFAEIVNCTKLPINVMSMPGLPDFDELAKLGVKRISMGNFVFEDMY